MMKWKFVSTILFTGRPVYAKAFIVQLSLSIASSNIWPSFPVAICYHPHKFNFSGSLALNVKWFCWLDLTVQAFGLLKKFYALLTPNLIFFSWNNLTTHSSLRTTMVRPFRTAHQKLAIHILDVVCKHILIGKPYLYQIFWRVGPWCRTSFKYNPLVLEITGSLVDLLCGLMTARWVGLLKLPKLFYLFF